MSSGDEKKPPGGLDKTPVHPTRSQTYTVKMTFHRADNIPISDFGKRSSDPFVLAQMNTSLPTRHSTDPPLRYRTHTVYESTEPEWESSWVVAGVPEGGFKLKIRLYDEDPEDHDDRLGKLEIATGRLKEGFKIDKEVYKMGKKGASIRAYGLRSCTALVKRDVRMHARLTVSVEVLGKTEEEVGKAYTLNCFWWKHFSPMIGRIAGTKAPDDEGGVEKTNFQSNEFQLRGPVPNELYHRFVEFKPFIGWMFTRKGVAGWALHKALHHQHERIYNFDPESKYGRFDEPSEAMTSQFLKMVHYDQGGRIFTYVITLDGMFRFTETGKEFGIDLLSKHTMHSDVHSYISWSGEFLVRRLEHPNESAQDSNQVTHPPDPVKNGSSTDDDPPTEPRFYELIIDNDSGTYRPEKSLLPVLQKFLEKNFVGLQIVTMACDDKKLEKIKEEQTKVKKAEGDHMVIGQQSDTSSISSSDASDLEDRANGGAAYTGKVERTLDALRDPKGAVSDVLPGKGKREREKREAKDDEAVVEKQSEKAGTA